MKTTIVFLSALFLCVICFAQDPKKEDEEKDQKSLKDSEIPAPMKTAFAKAFPKATGVKWSKESAAEFEAEFKVDGKEMASNFDQSGKWIVTETEIKSSELPAAVTASLGKELPGYKIDESEKVETADKGTYYEVVMKKGKSIMEVEISGDGKVMKKEEKKKTDDKD